MLDHTMSMMVHWWIGCFVVLCCVCVLSVRSGLLLFCFVLFCVCLLTCWAQYLDRGAPKEINVSHEVRVPLESMSAKLKRGLLPDCLPEVFTPSFNEVRAMVLLNVYPSFKKDVEAKKKKGGLLGRK